MQFLSCAPQYASWLDYADRKAGIYSQRQSPSSCDSNSPAEIVSRVAILRVLDLRMGFSAIGVTAFSVHISDPYLMRSCGTELGTERRKGDFQVISSRRIKWCWEKDDKMTDDMFAKGMFGVYSHV